MAEEASVTFVGNEGVLVRVGGRAILIDALFGDGVAAYTTTPRAVTDSVEMSRPPFDSVDVALATHFHPDHFNPYSTGRFLQHSPESSFVSTGQAVDMLVEKLPGFDALAQRIHSVAPREGVRESLTVAGVVVDAFGLSHGKVNYGDVQHLGLMVGLGGVTILHLGDGVISERSLRSAGVLDRHIDVAFLPFWYLTYPFGRRLMESTLTPTRVFAVHIPTAGRASTDRARTDGTDE